MSHAPGPWAVDSFEAGTQYIYAPGREYVGITHNAANARLIAAAPDLLDAAQLAAEHLLSKARKDPAEREVVRALEDALMRANEEAAV